MNKILVRQVISILLGLGVFIGLNYGLISQLPLLLLSPSPAGKSSLFNAVPLRVEIFILTVSVLLTYLVSGPTLRRRLVAITVVTGIDLVLILYYRGFSL